MTMLRALLAVALGLCPTLQAQQQLSNPTVASFHDSVSVHLLDVDIRAAVDALSRYVDRPIVFGSNVPGMRVTIETPHPIPAPDLLPLLRGALTSQGLELIADSGFFLVRAHAAPPAPDPTVATMNVGRGFVQLFAIHLKHARAADVAATVSALFGRGSALGEPGSPSGETLDSHLRSNQVPPTGTSTTTAPVGPAERAASLGGEVTIVPDPRGNSLLIRATQGDFELIDSAVSQLDTRPLQVLIEVIIAEVRRDRSLDFGLSAQFPPAGVRGSKAVVSASQTGSSVTDFVIQAMHVSGLDIGATLNAAASRGDVKILSRPVVIAANNELATINVGEERPFVQVSRTLPTDNAAQDQIVQYQDVGTKLTVLPTISPDGYIGLQVTQEVNSATTEVAFNAPIISTRSVQTRLLIKDGQTVALGGLTDVEHDNQQGGIPLLSSIPLLGGLFGHVDRSLSSTELYLFLTAHVIKSDEDAAALTNPLLKKAGTTP